MEAVAWSPCALVGKRNREAGRQPSFLHTLPHLTEVEAERGLRCLEGLCLKQLSSNWMHTGSSDPLGGEDIAVPLLTACVVAGP